MASRQIEVDDTRHLPLDGYATVQPGDRFIIFEHPLGITLLRPGAPTRPGLSPFDQAMIDASWQQLRAGQIQQMYVSDTGEITWSA